MLEFNVVLFGCSGVGKSSIVTSFESGVFNEAYEPTIEDMYTKEACIDGTQSILRILDTEGVENFHDMREVYIAGSDAFLLVYDVTKPHSVPVLEDLTLQIRELKGKKAVILLIGTKKDLLSDRSSEAIKIASKMASKLKLHHVVVSPKDPKSVHDSYKELIHSLGSNSIQMDSKKDSLSASSASIESWLYSPAERKSHETKQQPVLKRSALKLKKSMSKLKKSKSVRSLKNVLSNASMGVMSKHNPHSPDMNFDDYKDIIPKDVNDVIDNNLSHVTQNNLDEQPHIIDVVSKPNRKGCILM